MNITDELREWMKGSTLSSWTAEHLTAIADRIDAEHERECKEQYACGVERGIGASIDASMIQTHGYVELPKDADGEYIRIGDEMEGVDKYDSLKKVMGKVITVSFESDGIVDVAIQAWSSDGKSWHRAYLDQNASVYRHYHALTVEDVLREFAEKMNENMGMYTGEAIDADEWRDADAKAIAEYAKRLKLAEGED